MMDQAIPATIRQLVENVEAIASDTVDLPGAISALVKYAAQHEIDPYVILGVLVESIARTVALSIPDQKKVDTAKGVTHLLLDRFVAQGLMG